MTADQRVAEAVRQALARSKEPDPRVVARRLLPKLTAGQRAELVSRGLEELARVEVTRLRMQSTETTGRTVGPSKWTLVEREAPGGEWKMLADCTVDDLNVLADEYRERSDQMLAKERKYRKLAQELEASGCTTVGEMHARQEVAA